MHGLNFPLINVKIVFLIAFIKSYVFWALEEIVDTRWLGVIRHKPQTECPFVSKLLENISIVRTYTRKTDRGSYSKEDIVRAIDLVKKNDASIRSASKMCGINYQTLSQYCKRLT